MKKLASFLTLAALFAAPLGAFAAETTVEISETAKTELVQTIDGKVKGGPAEEETTLKKDAAKKAFKLPLSKPKNTILRFLSLDQAKGVDLSATDTLTFWLNNPKSGAQKLNLKLLLINPDGTKTGAGRTLMIPLDFEGWKEFKITYDSMKPFPTSPGDLSKMRSVDFTLLNPEDKTGDETLVVTQVAAIKQ